MRIYTIGLLVLTVAMTGCGSTKTIQDIDYSERDEFIPQLSFSKSVSEFVSVEIEGLQTKGERSIFLAGPIDAGLFPARDAQRLDLGRIDFIGPTTLRSDYNLQVASLGAGFKTVDTSEVTIRLDAGLGINKMAINFADVDTGIRTKYTNTNYGLSTKINIITHFGDKLDLNSYFGIASYSSSHRYFQTGMNLSYPLNDTIDLYAGWFILKNNDESQKTEITVESTGVIYGIKLNL